MANDSETVAEIVKEMRCHRAGMVLFEVRDYAIRIERAWRREKALIEANAFNTGALVEATRRYEAELT